MEVSLDHFGVLQIEPTDHCNLSCSMCAPHHLRQEQIHRIPKGLMDMGLYRRVIDGLVADDTTFDHIIFQWLGDPSIHPGLEDMIAYAQERMGDRVNVQDGAVVHTTRDEFPTTIGDLVTIGHLAMLHGCTVERGALIGIGARVLDGARIGAEAMVAAGALVPPGAEIPPRSLVLGAPARVRRTLSDEELAYNRETALNYRRLAAAHREAQREGRPSSA